jgi:signal peptidase I
VRGAANAALARISAVLRGPWRVTVAEASMLPAIAPGDWLLVDPTVRRWPRRGSIVVFREPETGALAVKRIAGLGGDRIPFAGGYLVLAADEAWLEADASAETAKAAGFGSPIDSHRFGPVPLELLVGRVWFRYGPVGRIGRIGRSSAASAEHPPDA